MVFIAFAQNVIQIILVLDHNPKTYFNLHYTYWYTNGFRLEILKIPVKVGRAQTAILKIATIFKL